MNERAAVEVSAVRALEARDHAKAVWTDADRAWASRAAAEAVGEQADPDAFLARRAVFALERISERYPALPRAVAAMHWRPWVALVITVVAFALGVAVDRIGGAQRINLLAPPIFALLVWNLGVYVVLAIGFVTHYRSADTPGQARRLVMRVASRTRIGHGRDIPNGNAGGIIGASVAALTTDWLRLAAPLYTIRAARILHFAAAALALGVITGLYVRGLAFEYRATWESTFLDASKVQWLLAKLLAPGSMVSGIAIPDVAHLESIRTPASENAATWLHLLAASVLIIVVIPRLLLGLVTGLIERHRAAHVAVPFGEPYYQRLLRGFRGVPVRVRVFPYSYAVPSGALVGLEAIVARAFGGSATLTVESPVAYGDEDAFAKRAPTDAAIALFNLNGTPEEAAHGAFVRAVTGHVPAQPLFAFVDESAFRARWPNDEPRLAQRRGIWSELLIAHRVAPIFVNLEAPDLASAEATIDAALPADDATTPGTAAIP